MSDDEKPGIRPGEVVPPTFGGSAYTCPWCGVLAKMDWTPLRMRIGPSNYESGVFRVSCQNCNPAHYWLGVAADGPKLIYPIAGGGPMPHADMPDSVRIDYEEAREIVSRSPRGACALLRLAAEKVVNELQPDGRNLNDRIGRLVAKGMPVEVQQGLDSLRVFGNESVHDLSLDLTDDVETASGLFALLNFIVEDRITRPKMISGLYAKLPENTRRGIADRDSRPRNIDNGDTSPANG